MTGRAPVGSVLLRSGSATAESLRRIERAMVVTLIALALLAATIAADYALAHRMNVWVQHSRELVREARDALALAIDSETGMRGFLISGDSALLEPYTRSHERVPTIARQLARQSSDNPGQQRRAADVARLFEGWDRDVASSLLSHPDVVRGPGGIAVMRRGKASFDAVRWRFASFINEEDKLYLTRLERVTNLRHLALALLLVEIVCIGGAAWWSDRRMLSQASTILHNNAMLEEQAVELELTIEESQAAARALEEAVALLDAAWRSAPTGFAFVDSEGRLSRTNHAFRELTGDRDRKPDTVHDLPPAVRVVLEEALAQIECTNEAVTGLEFSTEPSGGSSSNRRSWSAICYPVTAADRRLGVGVIVTETTQHLRMEAELRQAQKMDAIGQLAGGVAHDFNNVLTVINSYGQMLLEDMPPSRERNDIEQMVKAAHRAAGMTRQLLTFSRKEALQHQPINLNDTIVGMEEMLRRLLGEQVNIVTRLAPALPAVIGDPGQFEQVLMNLALNARDAMPGGGTLLLETGVTHVAEEDVPRHPGLAAGAYVVLGVSDTGIGMDTETQARIFEPFFTTKAKGKGTGIGMATVYGIVHQSNGHVGVYSEPGEGTTFRVWLPVAPNQARIPAPSQGISLDDHVPSTKVVLVADDEASVREVVERVLSRRGYTVIAARNGVEALAICREQAARSERIDMLITDVIMPEMSGPALAEQAREIQQELRVLFMSGYTGSHLTGAEVGAGITTIVEKPFTIDALLQRVAESFAAPVEDRRTWSTTIRGDVGEQGGGRAAKEMARRAVETERRAAAAAQRALEAQHRAVIDALQEGVMFIDTSGVIQTANPSAAKVLGADAPILGIHLRELPVTILDARCDPIPVEVHPFTVALEKGYAPPMLFTTTARGKPAGSQWWLARALSLHRSVLEGPYGVVWSFSEITDCKRAEESLAHERQFMEAVLENVSDGVLACDADGVMSLFNRAARELLDDPQTGIPYCEFVSRLQLTHPDGRSITMDELPMARALQGEQPPRTEVVVVTPSGDRRVLISTARPMRDTSDGDGATLGAVVALHDITAQKRSEIALREALHQARVAAQAKYDFLLQMSHELRTPLNTIIGFAGTLRKNRTGRLAEQDLQWIDRIQAAGRHLLKTFEDMLWIVDGTRSAATDVEDIDVGALIESLVQEFGNEHREGRVRLTAVVPAARRTLVLSASRLRGVLDRLVENALKFTSTGDVRVVLETDPATGEPRAIAVSDTGPGIPAERMRQIFMPFVQIESGNTRTHDGAGLGLPVALIHCRNMGADLSATSSPGTGSTFRITFGIRKR